MIPSKLSLLASLINSFECGQRDLLPVNQVQWVNNILRIAELEFYCRNQFERIWRHGSEKIIFL